MPFYIFYHFVVDEGVSLAPTYSSMAFACDIVKFELWNEFVHVWLPFGVCGQLRVLEQNAKSVI